MNFSIKKMFAALVCGALLVTAVPAQGNNISSFSDYVNSNPCMFIAAAMGMFAALEYYFIPYLLAKKIKKNEDGIVIVDKLSDFQHLKVGQKFAIENPLSFPTFAIKWPEPFYKRVGQGVLPIGKYTVVHPFYDEILEDDEIDYSDVRDQDGRLYRIIWDETYSG